MESRSGLITRRQALVSLATMAAGAVLKPTSLLAETTPRSAVRFAVVGDFGTGEDSQWGTGAQLFAAHQRNPIDFVVTTGDNIYPNGHSKYFLKKFEEPFGGLLKSKVPFHAVLGNHDVEHNRHEQCHYPLFGMNGQCFYNLRRGNGLVDFFMIDTTDFTLTQATWLEAGLRSSRAQWKIAVMHHPLYSSARKHGSADSIRKRLEPILINNGVKVVFAGHDHVYERTFPQRGIQHFVSGAAGKVRKGDIDMSSKFRAASYDQDNSFMIIDVNEDGIGFNSISERGDTVDSGVIKQI